MLADRNVAATVAVSDMDRARRFYEDVLGLEPVGKMDDHVRAYRSGSSRLIVYVSAEAGTNRANAAIWDLGEDFDAIMKTLKAEGVTFERYPELGMRLEGDIHTDGTFKAAWFKDPDGNVLHINNE